MQFSVILTPLRAHNLAWSDGRTISFKWLGSIYDADPPTSTTTAFQSHTRTWIPTSTSSPATIRSTISLRCLSGSRSGFLEPRMERLQFIDRSCPSTPSTTEKTAVVGSARASKPHLPACQLELAEYCSVYSFKDRTVTLPVVGMPGAFLTLQISTAPLSIAKAATAETKHFLECDGIEDGPLLRSNHRSRKRRSSSEPPRDVEYAPPATTKTTRIAVSCGCATKAMQVIVKVLSKGVVFQQPALAMSRQPPRRRSLP